LKITPKLPNREDRKKSPERKSPTPKRKELKN